MQFESTGTDEQKLDTRKKEVLAIYRRFNIANQHKMVPVPVCEIPKIGK